MSLQLLEHIRKTLNGEIASARRQRDKWEEIEQYYSETLLKIALLRKEGPYDSNIDVSGGSALFIHARGNAKLLTEIVRALRTTGWNSKNQRPEKTQTTWQADWDHQNVPSRIYLFFSSTVCNRVQVGVEMKEVPVYEIQCTEDIGEATVEAAVPATEAEL